MKPPSNPHSYKGLLGLVMFSSRCMRTIAASPGSHAAHLPKAWIVAPKLRLLLSTTALVSHLDGLHIPSSSRDREGHEPSVNAGRHIIRWRGMNITVWTFAVSRYLGNTGSADSRRIDKYSIHKLLNWRRSSVWEPPRIQGQRQVCIINKKLMSDARRNALFPHVSVWRRV
ncbi:uncharacterized protein LY79DRAFT_16559 [Colletotrichum navitas]|uniref:Uncharacterized protein n=1 Tax=Colletotrichum navitas TaxID=681940 RepID=A0AAD8QFT6_9PEZI|nr:uncharacterized protein LY79DRAFT_16559 [Colletotrichum navitas]KAK1600359.1 hypothetical protein LY79DRAFT_16559 [Colletotrichum navitas]